MSEKLRFTKAQHEGAARRLEAQARVLRARAAKHRRFAARAVQR